MKIALFYDWLNQWGGAERVLLDLINLFPQAPVYTLLHNPQQTPWLPPKTKIITSFINNLSLAKTHHRLYSPLYPLALEQFNFSGFDIVISTTTTFGHCLLTPPSTLFVCYCHTPNRQIWTNSAPKLLQTIDRILAQRPDYFIASSHNTQTRIQKYFHRPSQLVYPGINTSLFKPINNPTNNYFLLVSRLVPHKRIDLAIHACQHLNQKLIVVGSGRHLPYLQKISNSTTQFLGQISQQKLISLYQNCAALICPQHEDFGLTPLEAMACGRPVIALAKGGSLETVINGKTGIFFNHQTVHSLKNALKKIHQIKPNPAACRRQALKFNQKAFMLNFKHALSALWQQHQNTS